MKAGRRLDARRRSDRQQDRDPGAEAGNHKTCAARWSTQTGRGTAFSVTGAAGVTTVRLATASLQLAAVPLSAAQATVATAAVHGAPSGTTVDLEAVVTDAAGRPLASDTGTCAETLAE